MSCSASTPIIEVKVSDNEFTLLPKLICYFFIKDQHGKGVVNQMALLSHHKPKIFTPSQFCWGFNPTSMLMLVEMLMNLDKSHSLKEKIGIAREWLSQVQLVHGAKINYTPHPTPPPTLNPFCSLETFYGLTHLHGNANETSWNSTWNFPSSIPFKRAEDCFSFLAFLCGVLSVTAMSQCETS